MSTMVNGNILQFDTGVIIHQVNCMGVMGAGLAKVIREKYPRVYHEYKVLCDKGAPYGRVQPVRVSPTLVVCNVFAQREYSRTHKCTNESVLIDCIKRICKHFPGENIYVPQGIGCGLAGGNWTVVYNGIKDLPITIVSLSHIK